MSIPEGDWPEEHYDPPECPECRKARTDPLLYGSCERHDDDHCYDCEGPCRGHDEELCPVCKESGCSGHYDEHDHDGCSVCIADGIGTSAPW